MSLFAGSKLTFSAGSYFIVVTDVHSRPTDVDEHPIDSGIARKKVAVCPLHPQIYKRKNVWITVFPIDEVQSRLCAVSRKEEESSILSLQASMYLYDAGLMTAATPLFGKLDAVTVDSLIERRGRKAFPRTATHSLSATAVLSVRAFKSFSRLDSRAARGLGSPLK